MDFFRSWILPPLVGGIIGWFTNWLAIKMLFRPLEERRLFGLRLPFTPGILPRGRARLAQSIGDTVAGELFTPEVLRGRMADPGVRSALERGIGEALEELSGLDTGELLSSAGREASSGPLGGLLSVAWRNLAGSAAFAKALEAAVSKALEAFEEVPLSAVLPAGKARDFADRVLAPDNSARLLERIRRGLESLFDAGREGSGAAGAGPLSNLVPAELLEPLVRTLAVGLYRAAVPGVENLLGGPGLRREMETEARRIVHGAVERLGIVQRLFVGFAGYERRLSETMPETVEDLMASISRLLRDPAMPDRAADAVYDAFEAAASKPLAHALSGIVSREAAIAAADALVEALRDHGPTLAGRVAEAVAARADATVGGLIEVLGLKPGELARDASRSVASFLATSAASSAPAMDAASASERAALPLLLGAGSQFSKVLSEELHGTKLGDLAGLDGPKRAELASWLSQRAIELLSTQAERILEGVDIRTMVVERLNELEMAEVERIILGIVEKELTWITVLGGLLGSVIGIAQSILAASSR